MNNISIWNQIFETKLHFLRANEFLSFGLSRKSIEFFELVRGLSLSDCLPATCAEPYNASIRSCELCFAGERVASHCMKAITSSTRKCILGRTNRKRMSYSRCCDDFGKSSDNIETSASSDVCRPCKASLSAMQPK